MLLEVSGHGRSAPVVAEPVVDALPPELPDVPVPDELSDDPPVALSPALFDEPPPDVEAAVAFNAAVVHAKGRAPPKTAATMVTRTIERYSSRAIPGRVAQGKWRACETTLKHPGTHFPNQRGNHPCPRR